MNLHIMTFEERAKKICRVLSLIRETPPTFMTYWRGVVISPTKPTMV